MMIRGKKSNLNEETKTNTQTEKVKNYYSFWNGNSYDCSAWRERESHLIDSFDDIVNDIY